MKSSGNGCEIPGRWLVSSSQLGWPYSSLFTSKGTVVYVSHTRRLCQTPNTKVPWCLVGGWSHKAWSGSQTTSSSSVPVDVVAVLPWKPNQGRDLDGLLLAWESCEDPCNPLLLDRWSLIDTLSADWAETTRGESLRGLLTSFKSAYYIKLHW